MYTENDFKIITKIFLTYVQGLKELFLFGSYARGSANEESDIDIAIIMDKRPIGEERRSLLNILYGTLCKNGYNVDIVIKPKAEFDIDKSIPVTMAHTIHTEGKVLWITAND